MPDFIKLGLVTIRIERKCIDGLDESAPRSTRSISQAVGVNGEAEGRSSIPPRAAHIDKYQTPMILHCLNDRPHHDRQPQSKRPYEKECRAQWGHNHSLVGLHEGGVGDGVETWECGEESFGKKSIRREGRDWVKGRQEEVMLTLAIWINIFRAPANKVNARVI
ncbi:hypothetical protein BDK51DRAFT_33584 [Blyttiomyces helicus]|uniref:Uncharacterized protein n=1 Tax=Blyttiomyces helicus TaxID=388810 RepID=A0A4P9VYB7_9FUNG|nr:hypothetical protein BDK51DRAFT_33584 [Blyttiomyces helicus]|eukprot:RKO83310.1 hypothetical protein BDK51DRAFT_33584 [Blyttiomyces helicus]